MNPGAQLTSFLEAGLTSSASSKESLARVCGAARVPALTGNFWAIFLSFTVRTAIFAVSVSHATTAEVLTFVFIFFAHFDASLKLRLAADWRVTRR